MNERVVSLLPEYVLGGLPPEEVAEVEAALEASAELRAELDALHEDLGGLAVALTPVAPAEDVKARLMASLGQDRFLPFVDELARLCDLAVDRMKEVLRLADVPSAWEAGPMPGIRLIHFDHGPACLGADTGLVELPAGLPFPRHSHQGVEVNYILQGSLTDDDGTVYGPGTFTHKDETDVHSYLVGADEPIVMVVIHNGYDIQME